MGGRFEQKVDLFLLFFLSVREGGGGLVHGHAHPTLFLTLVLLRPYIYTFSRKFQTHFRLNKIALQFVTYLVVFLIFDMFVRNKKLGISSLYLA